MRRLPSSAFVLRWLPAPALLLILLLVGMAIGSESRADFQADRSDDPAQADDTATDGNTERSDQDAGAEGGGVSEQGEVDDIDQLNDSTDDALLAETVGPDISFEVRGDDGAVGIRLDPTGSDVAFPRTAGGESGLPTELTVDGLPPGAGFRLTTDGRLEAVPIAESNRGEIVIEPSPLGGVDLHRDDGSRVEIRTRTEPDGSTGDGFAGVELTEIDSDGTPTPLRPNGNGEVAVGDGISVQLPTAGGLIPDPVEPERIPWRWFLAWIVFMIVASLALALYLWRTSPALPYSEDFHAPPEVPVERFVDFLTVLRMDPDPARAIRLAFQGAEGGLGALPPRDPTETPFEWHARVAERHPHLDDALGSLCSRFTTARFAPERPSLADRDAAIGELEQLAYLAGYDEIVGLGTSELIGSSR